MRIPDCPGPERVMSVQAGDPEAVVGIIKMAIPYMYEQVTNQLINTYLSTYIKQYVCLYNHVQP